MIFLNIPTARRYLFLALFCLGHLGLYGQWAQKTSPITTGIYDIHAINSQTIFIGTGDFVFKSSDGGLTWQAPTEFANQFETEMLTSAFIEDIYFKNGLEGYAIGGGFFGLYHVVAKTVDGGVSWSLVYQDAVAGGLLGKPIRSMAFADETTAFAVGGNGKIISSNNGGASWQTNASFTSTDFNKILFLDGNTGFLAGDGLIAKTINQGTTWSSALTVGENFIDLHFYNAQSGIATTSSGNLYQTFDGGATWEINKIASGMGSLGQISFSGSMGYITGNPGIGDPFLLVTFDGGATWQRQVPNTNAGFYSIVAVGSSAFSGSLNGKIMSASLNLSDTKPIPVFSTNSINFCQNVMYDFTNESYPDYSYEWRVDGNLVSTNRDLQHQFPSGTHTIELTVKDGLRVGSKSIVKSFEGDYSYSTPIEVEFQNGQCQGESVSIKITNPEFGTMYKLYNSSGALVDEEETDYPSVTLNAGNLSTSQIFALKASRNNSCMTFETQRSVSITMHPIPTAQPTLVVAAQDICNAGSSIIDVINSDANVQYELYSTTGLLIASQVGNNGTIHLPTNHLTTTTEFHVKASVVNSICQKWFDDTPTVNVELVRAQFALSRVNLANGETLVYYNTSVGASTYQWLLPDGSSSTVFDPGGFTAPNPAIERTVPVKLTVTSNSGCSDEKTEMLSIYNQDQLSANCWATGFDINEPIISPISNPFEIGATHSIDSSPDGDIVVCSTFNENTSFASTILKNYSSQWNLTSGTFLAKYNSMGVLKWAFPIFRYGFSGAEPEIKVTPDGSIYLFTFGFGSYYSIDGDSISIPDLIPGDGVLVKYSNEGLLLESRIIEGVLPTPQGMLRKMVLDIDNSGNVYLSANRLLKIEPAQSSFTEIANASDNIAVCRDGSVYSINYSGTQIEFSKYNAQGNLAWEQTIVFDGLNGDASPTFLNVDENNNVYLATSGHRNFIDFPSTQGQPQHVTNSSLYLAKYNADGGLEWVTTGLGTYTNLRTHNVSEVGKVYMIIQNSAAEIRDVNGVINLEQDQSPLTILQYSTDGVLEFHRPIFDWPVNPPLSYYHLPTWATATDNGLVVLAPGSPANLLVTETNSFVNGAQIKEQMLLAKIGTNCETVPEKIMLSIDIEAPDWHDEMCPGFSFDLQYSVDEQYPIPSGNTFSVYLSNQVGLFNTSQIIGSLVSSARTGVIHVTMPVNISYEDPYYLWVVSDTKPILYSKAFSILNYLKHGTTLTYGFEHQTNNLTATLHALGYQGYSFEWTVNGQTLNGSTVTYTFPTSGSYYVNLKTTSTCGVSQVSGMYVDVFCQEPAIDQAFSKNEQTVNFSVNEISGAAYLWDFGDGVTSTDQNPSHTFSTWGIKLVKLTVTAHCGPKEVILSVDLGCAPITPSISLNKTDLSVHFSNTTGHNENSFIWNFGDGQTSTEKNPTHIYTSAGDYNVTLREFNTCSEVTLSQVVSLVCPLPSLSFTTVVSNQQVDLEVSNGNLGILKWDFGDGSIQEGTATTATHTYLTGGIFTICLTASSTCGVVNFCSDVSIVCPSLNPTIGSTQTGLIVQFENATATPGSTFLWQFGDGAKSTIQSPTHTYLATGNYVVSLTETNSCSTKTVTKGISVNCFVAIAQFLFIQNNGTVSFQNLSTEATQFSWDFGDGSISEDGQTIVNHNYAVPGTYQVCLQAISACNTDVLCKSVVIACPAINPSIGVTQVEFLAQFENLSPTPGTSVLWQFGDGNTSSLQNPSHSFPASGTYVVSLTETNGCNTKTVTKEVHITCIPPTAQFSFSANNKIAVFQNESIKATSFAWDFGDGSIANGTLITMMHEYAVPGTYQVCLQAISACNTNVICKSVTVTCPLPSASFTHQIQSGSEILFTNTSSNYSSSQWNFDDGGHSLQESPVHEFTEGSFNVCLEVRNSCGVDQSCQSVAIVLTGDVEDSPKWRVYPNPFSELLQIEYNQNDAATIRVQSVLGVNVHTISFQEASTLNIDSRHWASGVYILVLKSKGKSYIKTLIKK